jgi:hypothetical protein
MAFVNAFLEAGNEHRRVSVGGRSRNNETWAWLNCATADGTRAVRVSAEVSGPGLTSQERRRVDGDQRTATFTIELPEPGEHVKVRIREKGAGLRDLAFIGAMLCGLKGAQQIAEGDADAGLATIEKAGEIVAGLEDDMANLPDVELPGGVSLKHALACVEYVRRITAGEANSDN